MFFFFSKSLVDSIDHWNSIDKQNWKNIKYPWKISNRELSYLRNKVEKVEFNKMLLFGSTPEIRDEFCSRFEIDIIDHSVHMYELMTKIKKNQDHHLENFIKSDWIDFCEETNKEYQFIYGDLVLRLLSPEKLKHFVENLPLKNGQAFFRIPAKKINFNKKVLNLKERLKNHKETKSLQSVDDMLLILESLMIHLNNHIIYYSLYPNRTIQKAVSLVRNRWSNIDCPFYYYSDTYLIKLFRKKWKKTNIINIEESSSFLVISD